MGKRLSSIYGTVCYAIIFAEEGNTNRGEITSLQPPHCQLFGRRVLTRLSHEQSVSSPLEQALVTL